jgi:TolA-binding protein
VGHLPEASSSPFVRRRLRAQLMERAAKDGWSKARSSHGRLVVGLATAVLLIGVLFFSSSRWRSAATPEVRAARFVVEDVHQARWNEEQLGEVTRLRLSSGSAAFQVQKIEQRQRFLLLLPDGEIEVHGTRFLVEIYEGHTSRVSVTEGVVALRLQSQAERLLHAGEGWTRPEPTADSLPDSPPDISQRGEVTPAPSLLPSPNLRGDRPRSVESHTDKVPVSQPTNVPTEEGRPTVDSFAVGVSAFEAGDYRSADRSLRRFLVEAPSDPRTEDASFLLALARARSGDKQGAAQLAQKYLTQFPSGLRRKEAEGLLNGAVISGK